MAAGAKLFSSKITKTFLVYGFIWLAAFTFGAYFRFYPLLSYSSSDSYEKASLLVISRLRTAVADKIIAHNPHLSNAEKNKLIKDGLDYIMHADTRKVITSIDKVAKDIDKKFPAEKSYPYLLEADPYNYYSLTQNIVRTGKISDTIFASKYLNKRMLAPFGHLEPFSLHPYVGLLIYKFCNIFNPNIPLMYAVSFTPIVITGLALMAFLYVCYLLKYRAPSTFIGALFFMLSPIFIKRSAFGWYDNDPYNILFPFLIIAVFFLGIDRCRELKKSSFFVILNSFLIGLYALFWQGWVYLLAVIFIASVGILVYNHLYLKKKKETRFLLFYLGGICAGSFLMVSFMFGIDDFFILFAEGWRALKNFLTPQLKPWPDIFIGVGELRKISFKNLTIENGGFVFLVFSLLGFIAYGIKSLISSKHNNDPLKFIFLATFLGFSFFISLGAQRFALLTLIPLSIFFPLGLEETYQFFKKRISLAASAQHIPLLVLQLGFFIFLGVALGFSVFKAHETMLSWRPIFNETWDKTLTKIRQETPKESIVNSWWPPGHFITSIAERRVTFDGATINNPQAYWLANMFLSPDEVYAVGVLRMLNNSANRAVEFLELNHVKLSLAVKKIKKAVTQSRTNAKTVFEDILSPEQCEALLNLTHNTPAPSYVLVYNDLMEKNMELSFIGKWNFEAVEKIKGNPLALRKIPARNSPAYIKFLWDLAGGPYRNSETLSEVGRNGQIVLFAQDIAINLNNMTCRIHSKIFGSGVPQSIFYAKNNEVIERRLEDADLPFSVLLFKENPPAQCMVVDRELARSLLFRLYFFEGKGLKYFKPFIKEEDLTKRTKIYVYRIDWEGFKRDIER